METHIRILAVFYIVFSIVGILFGLVVYALFAIAAFFPVVLESFQNLFGDSGFLLIHLIGLGLASIILVVEVPSLLCGLGLLKHSAWARTFGIILGIFKLLQVPFGTLLGIYSLWVLFHHETVALFRLRN